MCYGPNATDYGKVDFQGTEAGKITLQSDPTTFPDPGFANYYGLFMGYHVLLDMDWVLIKHADAFLTMWNCANDVIDGGANIANCSAQYCEVVFRDWPGAGAVDRNVNNLIVVDGLFCRSIHGGLWRGAAYDMSGSNPIQNWAIFAAQSTFIDNAHNAFNINIASKYKFEITNFMMSGNKGRLFPTSTFNVGEWLQVTFTGLFADNVIHNEVEDWLDQEDGHYGVFVRKPGLWRALSTIQDSVIVNTPGNAIDVGLVDNAVESVTVQNCDLIGNVITGVNYQSLNTTLIIDGIYSAYNWGYEKVGSGGAAQPTHYQWWDIDNNQGPTNVESTNIFQLDVESVRLDHVSDATAVVTFSARENPSQPDSVSSPARKRLMGVPFVKYGKKSGELSSIAGKVPWDKEQRYEVFAKWRTDLGAFDTTNHQITIDALEGSTTYFFKPCFLDPLGRVAEWKNEGTFTTTSQGGTGDVSQAVYDSTYADLQRIKLEYDSTYNDLIRVRTAYDSTYNDLIRVRTAYDSTYNDLRRVSAEYDSTYNDLQRVRIDLADASRSLYIYMERYDSTYNDLIRVRTAYDSTYNDLQRIKISLDNTRRDLYRVTSQRDSTYNDLRRIQVEMDNTRRDLYTVRGQLDSTRRDLYRLRARQGTAQFRRELGSSGFFR